MNNEEKKITYALTNTNGYKTREDGENIVIPVKQVKGYLESKPHDFNELRMNIDGKSVRVNTGTNALSDLSREDKANITRYGLNEQRLTTISVDNESIEVKIAGLDRINKKFDRYTTPMPQSLVNVENSFTVKNKDTQATGRLLEFSSKGPVLQDKNGDATLYSNIDRSDKKYLNLRDNPHDFLGKNVKLEWDNQGGFNIENLEKTVEKPKFSFAFSWNKENDSHER